MPFVGCMNCGTLVVLGVDVDVGVIKIVVVHVHVV